MSSPNDTPASSKVREKLLCSEPVHFDAEKQTEKQREVPAQWVAKALREGHRVELKDAILTGPLDLQSAHVEQEFILFGCEVRGPVNAIYARFARWVLFGAVRFHDSVSFKGARFAAELNCTGTHFLKGVTFEDSIIEGSFVAPGVEFGSSKEDKANLNGCEIRRAANFVSAVFHGPVQFIGLTIGKQASFSGARFKHGAAFDRAEIGGSFFFTPEGEQGTEFGGDARFSGVKVGGQANFGMVQFKQEVSFQSATVEGEAGFVGVEFQKAVSFQRAEFKAGLYFSQPQSSPATFGGEARFGGIKVGGEANFNGVRFKQKAAFDGAEIGGSFFFRSEGEQRVKFGGAARFLGVKVGGQTDFSGARFEHGAAFDRMEIGGSFFFRPEGEQRVEFGGEARFHGIKVGGQAAFSGARFEQEAAFDRAEIGGSLFFRSEGTQRAEFGGEARFSGVEVGGQADFSGARFAKPAFFDGAVFSGPSFFQEAEFSAPLSFVNARFQLAAEFQGALFKEPVDFRYARFEQEAHFAGAKFGGQLKLRDARMTTLSFQEGEKTAYFDEKSKVDLLGCTYERLEIDGWRKLMDRQSEFNPRPWSHLEKVLRASGHKAEADDVYFNRRKQERKLLPWSRWMRWLVDILEWVFAGYGVRNERVVLSILALLLLGTVVFQLPGAVVPASEHLAVPEEGGAFSPEEMLELDWVSALGFSFKQLLPVSIPVLRRYEPAPGWPSLYASLHMVLGIVLITTAFATLSGLMRRAHPD